MFQGGVTAVGLDKNTTNSNANHANNIQEKQDMQLQESEIFDFCKDLELEQLNDSKEFIDDNVRVVETDEFQWDTTIKTSKKKTPTTRNNKPNTPDTSKQTKKSQNAHVRRRLSL